MQLENQGQFVCVAARFNQEGYSYAAGFSDDREKMETCRKNNGFIIKDAGARYLKFFLHSLRGIRLSKLRSLILVTVSSRVILELLHEFLIYWHDQSDKT